MRPLTLQKIKLGDTVQCVSPLKVGKAKVVDVFPANITPDRDKVLTYYAFKPEEFHAASVLKATKHNRWILQRIEQDNLVERYIVLPENRDCFKMIRRIDS